MSQKLIKLQTNKRRPTIGFHTNPERINRNGRPKKGAALTEIMQEILESDPELKRTIMEKLLQGAAKGDIAFIREVFDRIEGKPLQRNENKTVADLLLGYEHTQRLDEAPTKTEISSGSTVEPEV